MGIISTLINILRQFEGTQEVPSITEYTLSGSELQSLITPLGLEKYYIWDWNYYYASLEDWGKVFEHIFVNMPKYTADKFDCENFALLASANVSSTFKLNTCGIAIGSSPMGEHGFNLFAAQVDDKPSLFYLEPQTADVFPIEEPKGYKPRLAIFG